MTAISVTLGVPTTCRSCGAPIEWRQTAATGKLIPLDLEPRTDGNLVVTGGLASQAKMFDPPESRRVSHFATCPQAAKWRRGKK